MTAADGQAKVNKTGERRQFQDLILGKMKGHELDQLEEELFLGGGDAFDEALAEEAELLDAYARGELADGDRERVEELLAGSQRLRERLVTARVLAQAGDRARPPVVDSGWPWLKWGSVAAGLVVACLGGWLTVQNLELRGRAQGVEHELAALTQRSQVLEQGLEEARIAQTQLAQELAQRERHVQDLQALLDLAGTETEKDENVTVSFVLTSGLLRGMEAPTRHVIPEAAGEVRLQLDLEEDDGYPGYRVAVRKTDGGEIWSQDGLAAERLPWGSVVTVTIPASLLSAGRYEVGLFGASTLGFDELAYFDLKVGRE
jgi:hypothetical protein